MAYLRGLTNGPRTYTSVQNGRGPEDNINLNSDLEFSCVIGRPSNVTWHADIAHTQSLANHSCEPNATFDMSSLDRSKWQLRALKDIHPGDDSMSTDLSLIGT